LKAKLDELTDRLARLEASVFDDAMTAERRIKIREIAAATARGDKGPLKEWNRQRKLEYGL